MVFNDAVAARRAAHEAGASYGQKIDNPRIARKAAAKLRRAQKELARRRRGSANRAKSVRKVAKCHARVGDTRRDWLHKLSTAIVQENQLIAVEDHPGHQRRPHILAAGRRGERQTPGELVSAGTPVPQPAGKQEPAGSVA